MSYYQKHREGIIGTTIFHVIVLLILIFMGFFTPLPLPGEQGILVNFGDSEHGLGDIEPAPQRRQPEPPPPPQSTQTPSTPPPQPAAPPPVNTQPAKEEAMTQDYEQTAAIEAAERKRKEEADRQQRIEEQRRQAEAAERQRLAEIARQRQVEAERQRKAELERQRQAE